MKDVLIISYTFPPYPGIGGRRWAKFAKYLSRLGYTVHVIHSENYFTENSLWSDDIKNNPNIISYQLSPKYPKVLLIQPQTVFEKIQYRIALFMVKLFSKGTPYDRGVFWNNIMIKSASALISKHNIKNVVVSCAPFSSAYYSLSLKSKFPELNLLIDLRDPWTWGHGYGFLSLSKNRLDFEKKQEENVLNKADYILVPTEEMKKHLQEKYVANSKKIIELPHAFDADEITVVPKGNIGKTKLLFYGTLYNDLNQVFENVSSILSKFDLDIQIDFYTDSDKYKAHFEKYNLLGVNVNYYKPLLPKKLFEKITEYNYVLIIQPDFAKDFITTKIYEIIYSKTPIILISNAGKLSQFIVENKLGIWLQIQNLNDNFHTITETKSFDIEKFPIQEYSFSEITKELTFLFLD